MKNKINYLALIPIWGTVILFFWLFLKTVKQEVERKTFRLCFILSGFVGFLTIQGTILLVLVVCRLNDIAVTYTVHGYANLIAYIVGGYLLNLFSFILVNKKMA